jgi:hypothetical protein
VIRRECATIRSATGNALLSFRTESAADPNSASESSREQHRRELSLARTAASPAKSPVSRIKQPDRDAAHRRQDIA